MSAVYITAMGGLWSGWGININAVTTGEDGWIYLAGIDMASPNSLIVMAYENGNLAWNKRFNNNGFSSFEAITFRNGSVYAAGSVSVDYDINQFLVNGNYPISYPEKASVNPTLAELYPLHYRDRTYPMYVRLDARTGETELVRILPSPNIQAIDELTSIQVDSFGNVYVAGGGWNPGPNPDYNFEGGDFHFYTRKFSRDGVEQWSQNGGVVILDSLSDNPYSTREQHLLVSLDPIDGTDQKVIDTGTRYIPKEISNGTMDWIFDLEGNVYVLYGRLLWSNRINDWDNQHGLLQKIDVVSGNVIWEKSFGLEADFLLPKSIVFTPDGNLIVSGISRGNFAGKVGFGGDDGFMLQFNSSSGAIISNEIIGTEENEGISQIKYLPVVDDFGNIIDHNILIAGSFEIRRYSLVGRDEKDIYLVTDQGFELIGNALNNRIQGGSGDDAITAGLGDDELIGGEGNDSLNGGRGSDTVDYSDTIEGINVNLQSGKGSGKEIGSDRLINIETVVGGYGNDNLTASSNGSSLEGGSGDDRLKGGSSSDLLYGGDGDDSISAGTGNDLIVGGDGAGDDTYSGGQGLDTIIYSSATANITVNLALGSAYSTNGNDQAGIGVDTLSSIENIISGNFNDLIIGSNTNNILSGRDGDDSISGGSGRDILNGGTGSDTFLFSRGDSGKTLKSMDIIQDFTKGDLNVGDRIDFISALNIGGSDVIATAKSASIHQQTGVASFAIGSGRTLSDALADISTSFANSGNAEGQFALFNLNNTGNYYMFISDGLTGVGKNDVLIQLVGVSSVDAIDLTDGNLTIMS